jgi:hypothetical protein
MTHRGVSHGLLALTALWLSLPDAGLAEDAHSRLRPRSRTLQTPNPAYQQPGPAVGYHRYSPPPPTPLYTPGYRAPLPIPHHHHHRYHYPHGHRLHVHGPSCAAVLVPHAHIAAGPIWRVSVHPRSWNTGEAMLQIIVTSAEGDIYVDDYYLGSCQSLQGHPIDFPVIPGPHVVYFVHRGNVHPREVYVEEDSTTVVQTSLR